MILGVNTASDALAIALVEDGKVLAEALRDVGTEHSEAAFELLEAVFKWTGRAKAELRAVGVAIGPGGFTGVRTGMSMAKTIAQVLGIPIYGVETLPALALQFAGHGLVSPMIDARRGLVYMGVYGETAVVPGALRPLAEAIEILRGLQGPLTLVGEGVVRHRAALAEALPQAFIPPDVLMTARAAPVALASERRLKAGDPGDGPTLAPLYLREPQAVVNWEAAQENAQP
ncbi:MAG: universal protein YeaZ [Cyanobacteria bacterium RYN_339]|nr:universal protein YeaZ [Cyanobacteria bacterium RYN_339]